MYEQQGVKFGLLKVANLVRLRVQKETFASIKCDPVKRRLG